MTGEDNLNPIPRLPRPPSIYDTTREPEDESDLGWHPHIKRFPASGGKCDLDYGWQIIGASRRGYGHAYAGKYREDDFNIRLSGKDIALVAIADGLGSKSMSRRGARASVLGATHLPEERLQGLASLARQDVGTRDCQQMAEKLLLDALFAASKRVEEQAKEDQSDISELQTTLLVFLAIPCDAHRIFVSSVQVGDGALFAFQPGKSARPDGQWQCLQQQQLQAVGNEVEAFTRTTKDTWSHFLRCDLLEDATFIMGMTDGTADDIEPPLGTQRMPDPDPFLYVHNFYQHIQARALNERQPAAALSEFLSYRKRGSYDDRTVVCVYRVEEGQASASYV